jgi:hypothetical protein
VSIHFPSLLKPVQLPPRQATGQHTFRGERVMCARMSAPMKRPYIADIHCEFLLKTLRTLVDGIRNRTVEF